MRSKNRMLSGAALSAFAGTMLFAASAFAQSAPSEVAPGPGAASQRSAAEPGSEAQPYGATQQNAPDASSQQQMSSPQSTSPTMTNASNGAPLSTVKDAKTTLASASVQDSTGQPIGQVANVHTTKRGTPTTIDVMLQTSSGRTKTVAIKASKLEYDQSSNTLKTDLTSTEVESLPAATGM